MWLLNNAQDVLRLFCATSAVLKLHNSKTGQFFPFGRSFIALRTFNLAHLHHLKHSVWAFLKYLPICWLNTASLLEIVLFSLTFCFCARVFRLCLALICHCLPDKHNHEILELWNGVLSFNKEQVAFGTNSTWFCWWCNVKPSDATVLFCHVMFFTVTIH